VDAHLLSALSDGQVAAVAVLLARVESADGHPGLAEPQRVAVSHGDLGGDGTRIALALEGDVVIGCVVITPQSDGSHVLHVAVDPTRRSGHEVEGVLLPMVLGELRGPVRLWLMRVGPGSDASAAEYGFAPEREVLQMRVPLPLSPSVTAGVAPLATRDFRPGQDEEAWLALNNRAFADHPEQGGWTLDTLHERMALDWFDPAGFRVATDEQGAIVGSCWTKVHRHMQPELGEIYVISVDPDHQGEKLGKRLAIAGLAWLADQGISAGMLYTGVSNEVAVHLYHRLGFIDDHIDRCYLRSTG
jgi:mycothiol synthase